MQLRFLEHLYAHLKIGYSLLEALEKIKWDGPLAKIAEEIIQSLQKGHAIDQSFEKANFHYTIIAYLFLAKESGRLMENIEKCIQTTNQRISYRKKMIQTFRYPFLLFVIFIIILYTVKHFILPIFSNFLYSEDLSGSLLKHLLLFTELFIPFLLFIFLIILTSYLLWYRYKHKLPTKTQLKMIEKIPIYRSLLNIQLSYQFSIHLSALLQTGMPLNRILNFVSQQDHLPYLAYYAEQMVETLQEGKPIIRSFTHLHFLDDRLMDIFQQSGDQSTLGRDLYTFANMKYKELERKMTKILRMVQPILLSVVGIFIVSLYILLLWPLIQMIQQI